MNDEVSQAQYSQQTVKRVVCMVLAGAFGCVFLFSVGLSVIAIVGDIMAGAWGGEPETGWGTMIAGVVLVPLAMISWAVYQFLTKRYKRKAGQSLWSLKKTH